MRTTTIGFLALVVLSGGCEPGTAERCCEAMAGMFPHRPSVNDILEGYAGRRVYSQNDLIQALSDESVRRIIIAGDFETTQTITFWRDGVSVVGAGGAIIRSGANPVFRLNANDLSFRDLVVKGIGESQEAALVFETDSSGLEDNTLRGLSIVGCSFRATDVIAGRRAFPNDGVQASRFEGNVIDWVTQRNPANGGPARVRIPATASIVSGNVWRDGGGVDVALEVIGLHNVISGNALGGGVIVALGDSAFTGNANISKIVMEDGGFSAFVGNAFSEDREIDTSGSVGGNVIMGNVGGLVTVKPHANDLYETDTDGDPLNR